MHPVTSGEQVYAHAIAGESAGSLAVRRGVRRRPIADHEVQARVSGRLLDHGPEIPREVIDEQRTDLAEVEREAHPAVAALEAERQPLRERAPVPGRHDRVDERALRRERAGQRLERLDHRERAVFAAHWLARAWHAVDREHVLERSGPDPQRLERDLAAEAVPGNGDERLRGPCREPDHVTGCGLERRVGRSLRRASMPTQVDQPRRPARARVDEAARDRAEIPARAEETVEERDRLLGARAFDPLERELEHRLFVARRRRRYIGPRGGWTTGLA